ncbi:signal peptidase I [Cellulomonas alba]|uniref:Signal peptidase I n=1 Tax=Cellulomonas alba TaxID=3053467 RepID=A0ABT7SGW3_9CELL|nr:signal peptidase I [Cellulomonas alba]MDM7855427.1 signal peptidase I [Cellulomonas alba]
MLTSHAAPTRTALRGRAGRLRGVGSWIVFGLVVVLAVLLWPHQWGGRTSLTIVSGHSMDGTYSTGDLVVGRVGTAEVGDVVVFRPPGLDGYVVHRIVGGDAESGWVTRGDDNTWDDPWRPTSDDVVGVARWHVPHAWAVVRLATSPLAIVAYALVVVGIFLWPPRSVTAEPDTGPDADDPGTDDPAIDDPATDHAATYEPAADRPRADLAGRPR